MATIEELRREIKRQKNINQGINEMQELAKEKQRLELEYKMLKEVNSKKTNWSKIGSEIKDIGGKIMKVANQGRRNLEAKDKKYGGLGLFG